MAEYFDGILSIPAADYYSPLRRDLVGHRYHSPLEHLAEKSLVGNTARWGCDRLHSLVLERAAHLAKSASKLAIRCYSKSGATHIYPIHRKFSDERGS